MSDNYIDEDGKFHTQDLLADNFLKNLSGATKQKIASAPELAPLSTKSNSSQPTYNTEKLLMDLYETRDNLVLTFNEIGFTRSSQTLVESINKIGSCINDLGGKIDSFDPLANMSGLQLPKLTKSAQRVIENTRESYALNKIADTKIHEDGKTIVIAFEGKESEMYWKAEGAITPNDTWAGNEAIDYVYTPKSGRMAVKVPTSNGWIDKSAEYRISWELFESEEDIKKEAGKVEKNVEIKEEVEKVPLKDIDVEISDDFEIREK